MANDFGLKIGLEGEKEFKKALADINRSFKVLGSEMKLVESQFSKNDSSVQALTARNGVLTKEIDAQKSKVEVLRTALQNAADSFGETDRRTQAWQIQLNNAEAALNEMERELSRNNEALEEAARGMDDMGGSADGLEENLDDAAEDADDLGKGLKDAGNSAEKSESKFSKLGGVLKSIGAAMGTVAAAAGAAAFKLGQEVIQQFGELEQNLGGSEAVFGQYASDLQTISEDAYKTMGTSQSQYLATANKMGALFQGSGIEQQRSLELTTQAMQRAADMASVMGIDMESALEAVTGAAKGNYTMMDNLGVAMNNTTLDAYAMAKGYDKAFSAMSNAEKAEVAMSYFFEQTSQYAGNFEREATETISGSIGLMKAALSSFTAGLGNADADMQKLSSNLADAFQAVVKNVVPVIENIVTALPTAIDALAQAMEDLLPMLLETVTGLFTQVLETLIGMLPQLIPVVVQAVLTITQALIDNLPALVDAALQLVLALANGIGAALPQLIAAIPQIITALVQGLGQALPAVINIGKNIVQGLWEGIKSLAGWIGEKVSGFFSGIVDGAKRLLGIRSPSRVFARIGENMGLGLGEGFTDTMKSVEKDMQKAIPTDFQIDMNSVVSGTSGLAGTAQAFNVTIPLTIDGTTLTRIISQIQWSQNTVTVRNLGTV